MSKEEQLEVVFQKLNEAQRKLILSTGQSEEENKSSDDLYQVLEVAKLAVRGVYHTK